MKTNSKIGAAIKTNSQNEEIPKCISVNVSPYTISRRTKYNSWNLKIQKALLENDKKLIDSLYNEMSKTLKKFLKGIVSKNKFLIKKAQGIWEGMSEPSFVIEFNELNEKVIEAIAKLGMEFDQDEVHVWSNDIVRSSNLLVLQEDGSFSTPFVMLTFKNEVPFMDITAGGYGIKGATLVDGNKILMYQSELPVETGKNGLKTTDEFMNSVNKIIAAYKANIKATERGYSKLWRFTRDELAGVSTSYEQVLKHILKAA
jgi:hypothetical protein